jgi:hypothetical protein
VGYLVYFIAFSRRGILTCLHTLEAACSKMCHFTGTVATSFSLLTEILGHKIKI